MTDWTRPLRHYLLALQFFTRIPVTGALAVWVGFSPAMLRASAGHWPGVGALIGTLSGTLAAVLLWALPDAAASPWVAALAATAWGVWLTGAFHEDGVADLADGLGGSLERLRALEIMKDSRVGAFGALALVLVLLGKVSLLALLGEWGAFTLGTALLAGHTASRTWPLLTIASMAHIGDLAGSKSKPLAERIDAPTLVTGFVWCLGVFALLALAQPALDSIAFEELGWGVLRAPLLALLASALAWAWMRRLLARRLQGFTGDALGATQQACELAFYLGWALGL